MTEPGLSSRNVSLFRSRRPDVDKLRRTGDLAGLTAASEYVEPRRSPDGRPSDIGAPVRLKAVLALSEFYGSEVAAPLGEALADSNEVVRRAAVRGLRLSSARTADEPLLHALAVWHDEVDSVAKEEAVAALTELGAERLPERFADKLVEERPTPPTSEHEAILGALLAADGEESEAAKRVAESLLPRLEGEDPGERARAEAVLEWVAPHATDLLTDRLHGPSRNAAARLLGASGQPRAVEPLAALLGDPDPGTRMAAVRGLGSLMHTRAVEPLLFATRDSELEIRQAANAALDSMGVAAVVTGLAAAVRPLLPEGEGGALGLSDTDPALPWAQRVIGRLVERSPEAG